MDFNIINQTVFFIALLVALTMREYGRAFVLNKMGDPLPRLSGRLSMNPLVHADKVGTFIVPIMMIALKVPLLLGWAKPIPRSYMRIKNQTKFEIIVASAGPLVNFMLGILCGAIWAVCEIYNQKTLSGYCQIAMLVNACLMIFNLLPIPPSDGAQIIRYAFKISDETYMKVAQFGIFIFIGIIMIPATRSILLFCMSFCMYLMALIGGTPVQFIYSLISKS